MKVFVTNVDLPVGKAISKLLAYTPVGIRNSDTAQTQPQQAAEKQETYQVYGTVSSSNVKPVEEVKEWKPNVFADRSGTLSVADTLIPKDTVPEWIHKVFYDKEAIQEAVLQSDIVIYDLHTHHQQAHEILEFLYANAEKYKENGKVFILVSSVLTWAKTKLEDPEAILNEKVYRKRKPHPEYKEQINIEKNVIKYGKEIEGLNTFVISSGLDYHFENGLFHSFLKQAWQGEKALECFGDGENFWPMIYLWDLANIVVEVVETRPEVKYILAIEDSEISYAQVMKTIAKNLGLGSVKMLPKEDIYLKKEFSSDDIASLFLNLRMEPGIVKKMPIKWKYEHGFCENFETFVEEYKRFRGLKSIRVLLHGPPLSGKTSLAKKLCEYYEIYYLDAEQTVLDAISNLEKKIQNAKDDKEVEQERQKLSAVKEYAAKNDGKYSEDLKMELIREKLITMPFKNKGYVLEGYPLTKDQALKLFKPVDADDYNDVDKNLLPEYVFNLILSDESIKDRLSTLTDAELNLGKNNEEILTKRIEEFRKANTEDLTVLNFYDEREVHPNELPIDGKTIDQLMEQIIKITGPPKNYGPSEEQLAQLAQKTEEEKQKKLKLELEEKQTRESEEQERRQKSMEEWKKKYEAIQKQEQEALEAQSLPLRMYLVKNVLPTLNQALVEVCKIKPEDPIDFVAEFLFSHGVQSK